MSPIVASRGGLSARAYGLFGASAVITIPKGYLVNASNTVYKLTFATETQSTSSSWLSTGRQNMSSVSNSGYAGYLTAGNTGPTSYTGTNQIWKVNYVTDATSIISATISTVNSGGNPAVSNKGIAGYYAQTNPTTSSQIQKLTFSSEAISTLSATWPYSGSNSTGSCVSNYGVAGYSMGVYFGSTGSVGNGIVKLNYSSEATSILSATIPTNSNNTPSAGVGNTGVAGYAMGGYIGSGSDTSAISKLTFSSETTSSAAILSSASRAGASVFKDGTAGYYLQGTGSTPVYQKLAFPSDTRSNLGIGQTLIDTVGVSNGGA